MTKNLSLNPRLIKRRENRKKNIELRRSKDKEYYWKYREKKLEYNKKYRKNNKEDIAVRMKEYRSKNREDLCRKGMLQNCRRRAKVGNFECTLSLGDIIIPATCPILGISITHGFENGRDNSPSVDRIDVSKGYVPSNIQIISYRANRIKSDATPKELICIGKYLLNL